MHSVSGIPVLVHYRRTEPSQIRTSLGVSGFEKDFMCNTLFFVNFVPTSADLSWKGWALEDKVKFVPFSLIVPPHRNW